MKFASRLPAAPLIAALGRGKTTDADLLAYGKGINLALLEKIASE